MVWPVAVLYLLGVCLVVDVSGQTITFTSSLQSTRRNYVCPEEIVTYVCSGVGNEIRLYAPPYISQDLPLTFVNGDTLGSGRFSGPIVANLISTSPLMIADLIVQNSSLPEFSVYCIVSGADLQLEAVQHHRPEGNGRFCY